MNSKDFDAVVEQRLEKIRALLIRKGAEYAYGGDRLSNFKRAAAVQQCTPERALVGMLTKHIVSILDIIDNIETKCPSIDLTEEKIGDYVNYGILLEALIKERIQHEEALKTIDAAAYNKKTS